MATANILPPAAGAPVQVAVDSYRATTSPVVAGVATVALRETLKSCKVSLSTRSSLSSATASLLKSNHNCKPASSSPVTKESLFLSSAPNSAKSEYRSATSSISSSGTPGFTMNAKSDRLVASPVNQ